MFSSSFSLNKLWHFGTVFKIRSETCRTKAQFCQNLYMIKKESLPDRPKFCGSASAVRHLFWRLLISRQACFVNQVLNMWSLEGHKNNNFFEVLNKKLPSPPTLPVLFGYSRLRTHTHGVVLFKLTMVQYAKCQHWFKWRLVAWSTSAHQLNRCWWIVVKWIPWNKLIWNFN